VFIATINIRGESIKDDLLLELKETFKELSLINSGANPVPIRLVNATISLSYNSSSASYISILSLLVLLSLDCLTFLIDSI
jgi:hypothetical protein